MTMRASLIITAVDQASAPFARMAAGVKRLGENAQAAGTKTASASRGLDKMRDAASSLGKRLQFAAVASASFAGQFGLLAIERAAYGTGYAIGGLIRKMATLSVNVAKIGATTAVAAASFGIVDIIRTGMQFETFEATLRNMTGSAKTAKESLAWIRQFATSTPYEMADVTAAFIRAKQRAFDPMDGSLRVLGDAASSLNAPLENAIEAVSDGMHGQFERLLDFGIQASKSGDKVKLTWIQNGKEMSKSVNGDLISMRKELLGIFKTLYGGAMAAKSGTLEGIIANLKDQWGNFKQMVADAGIYKKVRDAFAGLLAWTDKLAQNGQMQEWAKRISDQLSIMFDKAVTFIKDTDWPAVARGMGTIVATLTNIIGLIGKAASAWSNWQADVQRRDDERIVKGALGAVSIGGVRLWGVTDQEKHEAQQRLNAGQPKAPPAPRRPLPGAARPAFNPWQIQSGASRPPPPMGRTPAAVRAMDGRIKVDLTVNAAPGVQVRSNGISSSDRNIVGTLRTGKTMAGGV